MNPAQATMTNQQQAKQQAQRLVSRRFAPRLPRKIATSAGMITSLGTKRIVEQCAKIYLEWRSYNELPLGQQDNLIQLCAFLEERSEIVQQATLSQSRNSLQLLYGIKLPVIHSQIQTCRVRRSYEANEIAQVITHQSEKNALTTVIAYAAGLRAHEPATIRRLDELQPSSNREWDSRRFLGLGEIAMYIVTGKGGLRRQIALPQDLADMLERRRLKSPEQVVDRGIFYNRYYDIGFGQAFSQSFTDASKAGLRFSRGAHGLRHTYAKIRTQTLRALGLTLEQAQLIVSQELGHFRPSITIAYYR